MSAEKIISETERFRFVDWGRCAYVPAIEEMKAFVDGRIAGVGKDTIFFVEHNAVVTMGRRASDAHLIGKRSPDNRSVAGIPIVATDRGGDVTLHSPGQLVIYPVIALTVGEQRLHDLLAVYEELIIRTAAIFGVHAFRRKGKTGAWTSHGKLASIGIHLRRWTTYHGIALNVSNDLSLFNAIVPCGLYGITMTSLEKETGHKINITDVKRHVVAIFPEVWDAFRKRKITTISSPLTKG